MTNREQSLFTNQVDRQAGFRSMKQLGILLLLPGWDASPSQGYPQRYDRKVTPSVMIARLPPSVMIARLPRAL